MPGDRPAALACSACARPISPPSTVTTELLDMFCALNGATVMPLRASSRQSPATPMDLPPSELVPAISSAPAPALKLGQDLGGVFGDHQRVLELRGPLAVGVDDGPVVVPDLGVQLTEVDHRLDGEGHARLDDRLDSGLGGVQHHKAVVERGADAVPGEVANNVVAEAV